MSEDSELKRLPTQEENALNPVWWQSQLHYQQFVTAVEVDRRLQVEREFVKLKKHAQVLEEAVSEHQRHADTANKISFKLKELLTSSEEALSESKAITQATEEALKESKKSADSLAAIISRRAKRPNEKIQGDDKAAEKKEFALKVHVSELVETVKTQEADLALLMEKLQLLTKSEAELKARAAELESSIKAQTEELAQTKEDIQTERNYVTDLRARHKSITQLNEDLRKSEAALQMNLAQGLNRIEILEKKVSGLQDYQDRTAPFMKAGSDVEELRKKVVSLEIERDLNRPLLEIALHIRERFSQQAREIVAGAGYYHLEHSTIARGNHAAHGGNGEADAWIILDPSFPIRTKNQTLNKLFKELYRYDPEDFLKLPRLLREAINCEATIRTLNAINHSMNRPTRERQTALDNIDILCGLYPKLSGELYDDDANVKRRLAVVHEFTKFIVYSDRRSNGAQPPRRESNGY